jgi:DNA repair and recombination protein RAD52
MPLSQEQKDLLNAPLMRDVVKTREQSGKKFSYIEAWHGIAEANRIFGFDGWISETILVNCVSEKERSIGAQQRPGWGVTYTAKVRVVAGGVFHDGVGAGHGIDVDLGQAHESAIKEAESDARKRALMQFGHQFGLALYDKTQSNVADTPVEAAQDEAEVSRQRFIEECKKKIASYSPDQHELMLGWWHSDQQRAARRDFDLSAPEVLLLKGLITEKLPKRTG